MNYFGQTLTERHGSIRNAVEHELDGSDYGQGALEDAAKTARKTSACLANLIALLAEKGVITEAEVDERVLTKLW